MSARLASLLLYNPTMYGLKRTAVSFFLLAILTSGALAAPPATEQVMGLYFDSSSAQRRLQELVRDPSAILQAFVPDGISYSHLQVSTRFPRLEFQGSPKTDLARSFLRNLGFPESFSVVGELTAETMRCGDARYLPQGYRFTLELRHSHALLAHDVNAIEFQFCQKKRTDGKVELHGKGQLLLTEHAGQGKAGNHPIEIAGWQFWAFWKALKLAVEQAQFSEKRLNDSTVEAAQGL